MKNPDKYKKLLEYATIYESLPDGWRIMNGATNHPNGYVWICNNKSLFDKDRRTGLMKVQS